MLCSFKMKNIILNDKSSPSLPRPPSKRLGYVLAAGGAMMFATKGIVIKLALIEGVGVLTTLTWRMIIAVPIFALIGWLGYRHKKRLNPEFFVPRAALLKTIGVGTLGYYLASYLDFAGLEYITAQLDRLILMTSPIFVVLISAVLHRQPLSLKTISALLLSYIGLALIFWRDLGLDGTTVILGSALVLGAAVSYAIYQILAKPLIDQMGARLFTSIAMSSAGIVIMVQFALTHSIDELWVGANAMWLMLAMGTISTVLPAYLISAGIGIIGPGPTAVLGNFSPLVTIALAVGILGEVFTIWHALGAAMVLIGVFAFTRFEKQA
jgi:drug/metabolite transporter (DMT)-like permease